MKPGVVFPNKMASTLGEAGALADAGAQSIVALPSAFVDDGFNLTASPDDIAAVCETLELAAIMVAEPLQKEGDSSAGAQHLRSCIDLADALRDYFAQTNLPLVVCDVGPYASGQKSEALKAGVAALQEVAKHAEERQVIIGIRPDRDSAVDRARGAVSLLGDVGSSYVQVALDAAGTVGDKDALDDAVGRLKDNIVIAFARDVKFDADGTVSYPPPGNGALNFTSYVSLLSEAPGCAHLIVGDLSSPEELKVALAKVSGFVKG